MNLQHVLFRILTIAVVGPPPKTTKPNQNHFKITQTHSKPRQNHLKPLKVTQTHSKPPQNCQLWFHVGSSWLNLGASWPRWPLNSSTLASCWLKLAQLGCKLAKLAPSWRLPDLKNQGKTTVFFTMFQNPIVGVVGPKLAPCWLNLAQVSSKLAHLGSKLAPS